MRHLARFTEGDEERACVDEDEGDGDERQGGQGTVEDQAAHHREEGGAEAGRYREGVVEIQESARGGEQGDEDEIADAESEPSGLSEGREDEEQEIQGRGVFLDESSGRAREDGEQIGDGGDAGDQ